MTAETYYRAAIERTEDAHLLHTQMHYSLAMYVSGLAVECMLRAFRLLTDTSFEERHDLWRLWKKTALADIYIEPAYSQIYQNLITVTTLWKNDLRFHSQSELKSFLKSASQDRGVKGDALKYLGKKLYESAIELIRIGGKRWRQLSKK